MEDINEFWYCVSPQEDLPLFKKEFLISEQCESMIRFINKYNKEIEKEDNDEVIKEKIKNMLLENPDLLNDLRIIVGITNKRLYLDLSYIFNKTTLSSGDSIDGRDKYNLIKHSTSYFINQLKTNQNRNEISEIIIEYLVKKNLLEVVKAFCKLNEEKISIIFNTLISAREAQQKEAKYRGHGAEMVLAQVIHNCGINYIPTNKHIDPMETYDPNVNLKNMEILSKDSSNPYVYSFDLILKAENIIILVQSLIHSSDPGQYGVNKSNDTKDIKKLINEYNRLHPETKVYLWGLVDGVGFSENPQGTIIKMQKEFDLFIQINTLFKVPLELKKIGLLKKRIKIVLDKDFFDDKMIRYYESRYDIGNFNEDNLESFKSFKMGKSIVHIEK